MWEHGSAQLLTIKANLFRLIVGGTLEEALTYNKDMIVLEDNKLFGKLSQGEKETVSSKFVSKEFKEGETVVKEGERGDSFYVLRVGEADVFLNEEYQGTLNENGCFGEISLLKDEKRKATVVAKMDCTFAVLHRNDFNEILLDVKLRRDFEEEQKSLLNTFHEKLSERAQEIDLEEHLLRVRDLGSGLFGEVLMMQEKKDKHLYALKTFDKAKIEENKFQKHIMADKKVLEKCLHPFILRLYATFKDSTSLYMLLEYVPGGDLLHALKRSPNGRLSEADSKFYCSAVAMALFYLHTRDIAYRNLMPENVVIGEIGSRCNFIYIYLLNIENCNNCI